MTLSEKKYNRIICTRLTSSCNDLHLETDLIKGKYEDFIITIEDNLAILLNKDKLRIYEVPEDRSLVGWKFSYLVDCDKTEQNAESFYLTS